jgi:hypothetical protein
MATLISLRTGVQVMAETMTAQPKSNATRSGSVDKAVLAQVEKWMAIIREVSGEKSKN